MKYPKVSVIMSVYNGETYLAEAIESILAQTFTDFEFLIVNDGSTDGSSAVIRGYNDPRIRIIENPANIGLTKSLNIALASASGVYIARQDSDDASLPSRFAEQVAFMDAHPEVAVLGTASYRIDEKGAVSGQIRVPENPGKLLFKQNQLTHGSVMVRKSVIEELGGYNELIKYGQDYELWLRIARHYRIMNLRHVLYRFRYHAASISVSKREESMMYHFLNLRIAGGQATPETLARVKEKGILSLYPLLKRGEKAYYHREIAGTYVSLGQIALARRHFRRAFIYMPWDVKATINHLMSFGGSRLWLNLHYFFEKASHKAAQLFGRA